MGLLLLVMQDCLDISSICCSAMSLLVLHLLNSRVRPYPRNPWDWFKIEKSLLSALRFGAFRITPNGTCLWGKAIWRCAIKKSSVECPNVLELFILSPVLMVATCQTTVTIQRVNWGVYFACSKCLIIINVLKCSVTTPFLCRQQPN